MSQIIRYPASLKDFKSLTSQYFNQTIDFIDKWWNDHDSGVRPWTVVNALAYQKNGSSLNVMPQIIFSTSNTPFITTNMTFTQTNLSASITPISTTSKVLVIGSGTMESDQTANEEMQATLFRGSTNLGAANGGLQRIVGATANTLRTPCTMVYLDSPSSTSSIAYSVRILGNGQTISFGVGNEVQTMILIEVVS